MVKTIAFGTIAAAAVATATFWCIAEPAEAKTNQYCRTEPVTNTRQCGYDTMEQCVAAISGLSGTCARDPFYGADSSYAYAPKTNSRSRR